MYTKELLAFVTVAGEGSFLKAAKKLYLTPASVMNQINKLEQHQPGHAAYGSRAGDL